MKFMVLWSFQVIMLCSALAYMLLFIIPLLNQSTNAVRPQNTEVLGASRVNFYHENEAAPEPDVVHELVNEYRDNAGLSTLVPDATLADKAYQRAMDMKTNEYYAHESPLTGETFADGLKERGVDYRFTCENLNLTFATEEAVSLKAWLGSNAGHRECLAHPGITHVGYASIEFSATEGERPAYIIVAIYAAY